MAEKDEKEQIQLTTKLSERLHGVARELEVDPGEVVGRLIEQADAKQLGDKASESAVVLGGPPRTPAWVRLAGPFGWFVLGLAAVVFIGPFFAIVYIPGLEPNVRVERLMTWGTHVLAAVVGFVGAVVTYFFGAGGGERGRER